MALFSSIGYYPELLLAAICFLLLSCLRATRGKGALWDWPVMGMLPGLLVRVPRFHDEAFNLLAQSNWTLSFRGPWFANMDMVFTSDPANVHHILSKNFPNFPKGPEFYKIFDILGDGIFNADEASWRAQRHVARALINHGQFQQFLEGATQKKVERGLCSVLEHAAKEGVVLDLQEVFQRYTFDLTCRLVNGYDPESLSVEFPEIPYSNAMDEAERALFLRHLIPERWWKLMRWLKLGAEGKLSKARETVDHVVAKYIKMKREELLSKSTGENLINDDEEGIDLLTSYMKEDGEALGSNQLIINDKFLRDTMVNFMLAGRSTTSAALTWFFYLLSKNPLVVTKIREELQAAGIKKVTTSEEKYNWERIRDKLVYLHGALCESLRLYPPVPFVHKAPLHPDVLPSGHHVNPTTKILFSLHAMGRMDSLWGEDCLEFKPERWISQRGRIKHEPSNKFPAFNAGPRTCLGKEVAFTQMKAAAAAIIQGYDLKVVEGHAVAPELSIIIHMKHGLMVEVSKRSDQGLSSQ